MLTYKDVVYSALQGNNDLVWCEYRARLHTLIQVRYQVRVYEATEEIGGDGYPLYRKGASILDSSWKLTPQKARKDVEDEVGALRSENIKYKHDFPWYFPILMISEEF